MYFSVHIFQDIRFISFEILFKFLFKPFTKLYVYFRNITNILLENN